MVTIRMTEFAYGHILRCLAVAENADKNPTAQEDGHPNYPRALGIAQGSVQVARIYLEHSSTTIDNQDAVDVARRKYGNN